MVALRSLDPLFSPSLLLFLLLPATSFRARKEDATSPRAIRRARIIHFFNPFFFSTRDEQGDKTGDNSLLVFIPERSLARERTGQPGRPHRCRSRATWIHPKSNLPATQTRWLNALICTRLCDRDGKGGGASLYVHRRIGRNSTGERFRRWRVCKAIAF